MIEMKNIITETGFDITKHKYFGGRGVNGTGLHPKELDELISILEELSLMGIVIKGIDTGLIDFPHINKNGIEVYLCYIYGEEDILAWHRVEDGFRGRQGLDTIDKV